MTDVNYPIHSTVSAASPVSRSHPDSSLRKRIIILVVAWVVTVVPFTFFRSEWFGRPLSDQQIGDYLHSDHKPRQIEYALAQISDRMARHDQSVSIWYADLVRLAYHPMAEIRSADAAVLAQDTSQPEFHEALRRLLRDESPAVRTSAALSLVSFDDAMGHDEVVALLKPWTILAPVAGRIKDAPHTDAFVHQFTPVLRIQGDRGELVEPAPISGRILRVTPKGSLVVEGQPVAEIEPAAEYALRALRALYVIGRSADLPLLERFEAPVVPERIRQQALLAEQAIRDRIKNEKK